jgi:hypothetical protein
MAIVLKNAPACELFALLLVVVIIGSILSTYFYEKNIFFQLRGLSLYDKV